MVMKKLILSLLFIGICCAMQARVVTTEVYSAKMRRAIPCVVVLPDDYNRKAEYAVVYLLHGYGGDEHSWPGMRPDLSAVATRDSLIFVCPDGEKSWYWDSPVRPESQFETFVAEELVRYIDKKYATRACREGRAITGLSMGGHGALWLAIRHPETFGAAGSTSGGVDIRPFPENWGMKSQLGAYAENPERWDAHTVINRLDGLKEKNIALIIDCGYSDFFAEVNNNLHTELLRRRIPHDYYTRPGAHNGDYWRNSLDYQLLFFNKYFQSAR